MAQPKFSQIRGKIVASQTDFSGAASATDPATRQYVIDQITSTFANRDFKDSVRAASTANVSLSSPGANIDGVALNAGDRLLLKNQTTASQNGIYVWTASGSALTRSTDADTNAKVTSQLAVAVEEGTTNANTVWKLNTSGTITLGTTSLTFGLLSTSYFASPTISNKDMVCVVTVNDGDVATNTAMAATPANGSYVAVLANGVGISVGNGVKTKAAYFSSDSGTTAKALNAIASGDKLYWNGSIAGYQLDANDTIDFNYVV